MHSCWHAFTSVSLVLQVWTAHESAARELMSLELEDMQQQVDKMSNEELAQVAVRMMAVCVILLHPLAVIV